MKRIFFFAMFLVSCGSPHKQARIDAYGMLDLHDPSVTVQKMELCADEAARDEAFGCLCVLGSIHTRRGDWVNAEDAWRRAFDLRDRIAQEEGFGPPHHEDLWHWAYAASEIGAPDRAAVVTRARAEAELYVEKWGEGRIVLAVSLMLEKRLHGGEIAAGIDRRVRENACEVKDLKYYRDGRTLDAGYYLPTTVWFDLYEACGGRTARETIWDFAMNQAQKRAEPDMIRRGTALRDGPEKNR